MWGFIVHPCLDQNLLLDQAGLRLTDLPAPVQGSKISILLPWLLTP